MLEAVIFNHLQTWTSKGAVSVRTNVACALAYTKGFCHLPKESALNSTFCTQNYRLSE